MTADRDERLAALLDDLTRQQRRGSAPDLDPLARQHPDIADELRQLWAAAQMADAIGRSASPAATLPARAADLAESPPRTFGDFELLRELGRGGMGVVYEARQRSLNRTVALKMVLRGELASSADFARFRAEAEAAARLVHPNIVQVYEIGEAAGLPYFAMQYVPGSTLARRLTEGPLPPREAARLIASAARGVDHAHQNGVLHRDLKPANVLLASGGCQPPGSSGQEKPGGSHPPLAEVPKITDFGLAKLVDAAGSLTQTGAIVGTPSYMAPEQARAEKQLTPAADVYALGAILYECLTGRPPFQAATALDTLMLVLEQDPVPPRLLNPGVPRDLETVCLKCLEKTPSRRYASAAALAADLEAFVGGEQVAARPSGLISFIDRLFQETPNAAVLENWGLLWMWHSLVILLLCTATQVIEWTGHGSHTVYLTLWSVGLITWGTIFWQLRRRGGPVRFVERQIGHAWAAGVSASIGMFVLEVVMGYPPLAFSPLLAIAAAMVFLFQAGVLAGLFYFAALAMFVTSILMALFPQVGVLLFGIVTAGCFFFPGLKYYRRLMRAGAGIRPRSAGSTRTNRPPHPAD